MNEQINELLGWMGDFSLKTLLPAVIILVIGMLTIRLVVTVAKKILQTSKLEKAAHSLIISLVRVVLYQIGRAHV